MNHLLRAGVGRRDITPPLGTLLMGYADPHGQRAADRVRDPLRVTAVVFEQQGRAAVLISADVIVVDEEASAAICRGVQERTGIDGSLVTICAIQTHSGPRMQVVWGWGDRDDAYVFGTLVPRAIEAVAQAHAALTPVRVGIGQVESRTGINRRSTPPGDIAGGSNFQIGHLDPFMTVLRLESAKGTLANLVHYGAHPTVLGGWSKCISRDWPGILIDRVEHLTGAPTLYFGGASGDVAPNTNSRNATGDEAQAEAALWEAGSCGAMDAMLAWRSIKDFRDLPLQTLVSTIDLPYRPLPTIEEVRQQLAAFEPRKQEAGLGMCEYKHWKAVLEVIQRPVETAKRQPTVITALGPVAFVPVPGEHFAETSLRLRLASPFQYTLMSSLCNGCTGYFWTLESTVRGGYEPWVGKAFGARLFADGIDDVLVNESVKLLKELYPRVYPPLQA